MERPVFGKNSEPIGIGLKINRRTAGSSGRLLYAFWPELPLKDKA